MAQLRQNYEQFETRETEVVIIGPEDAQAFHNYFTKNDLPFTGLPDPKHSVLRQYGQEINLFKFGRMPAQVLVDKKGVVRFVHYGHNMSDIPPTDEIVELIDRLSAARVSKKPVA